ncbi:hypothetical protein [Streptosporangium sp. NPDC004631]
MTGWWRRARVVSAVGAGTLVLGGGSAVYAIETGESVAAPSDVSGVSGVSGAEDLNSRSRWVRTGDVIRFRVWLRGPGSDARLVVVTTPAGAFRGIDCPAPGGDREPVRIERRMCPVGEVGARRPVDVLLAVPEDDQDIELTAVARMFTPEGEWTTQTARTRIEAPVALAVQAAGAAAREKAPGTPDSPGTVGTVGTAEAAEVGRAGRALTARGTEVPGLEADLVPTPAPGVFPEAPGTVPADSRTSAGVPAGPGAAGTGSGGPATGTPTPGAAEPFSSLSPSVREVLEVPGVLRDLGVVGEPEAHAVPPVPRPEAVPAASGSTVPEGGAVPEPQIGEPESAVWPDSPPLRPLKPLKGRKSSRPPAAGPVAGTAPAAPVAPPAPAGLAEAGQMPQLWNDPNLRMPLAAPTPIVSPPPPPVADSQPPGAPLPRDVDGPGPETTPVALSGPFLAGARGLPAVGAAVGGLLGLLWLQARIQRRRGPRPV